jgi:hypothetical protein
MWEPQPLATLRASADCTGIALPFTKHEGNSHMSSSRDSTVEYLPFILNITKESISTTRTRKVIPINNKVVLRKSMRVTENNSHSINY